MNMKVRREAENRIQEMEAISKYPQVVAETMKQNVFAQLHSIQREPKMRSSLYLGFLVYKTNRAAPAFYG